MLLRSFPVQALVYSRAAADLKPVPHILDTLAESYFINGLYDRAIESIRIALNMNPENRDYYEEQLSKFQKALSEK